MPIDINQNDGMFTVGELVLALRKRRKWTQADLADKSGLGVMAISAFENDETNYERDTLRKLARAFGFDSVEALFFQLGSTQQESAITMISPADPEGIVADYYDPGLAEEARNAIRNIFRACKRVGPYKKSSAPKKGARTARKNQLKAAS